MRYRLPKGCVGVAGAGAAPAKAGNEPSTIEADATAAEDLAPHGIVPIVGEQGAEPARPAPQKRGARK